MTSYKQKTFKEIRDDLRPRDLHFRKECNWDEMKCGAHVSWKEGFDAGVEEMKKRSEILAEAIFSYREDANYTDNQLYEALEAYRKSVGE